MYQKTIFDQHNLKEEHAEMLKFLVKKHLINKTPQGYFWKDTGEPLGERTFADPKCPECGRPASQHPYRARDLFPDCEMVLGRRGWRQLGEYDG